MVDNRNGDPWYELTQRGATPEQIKWAEERMRQGLPYADDNGDVLAKMVPRGSPAPGKEDRFRPIRDPETLQPIALGNADFPPGNKLTPNAAGYGVSGIATGEPPITSALDAIEKAAPGNSINWTPTRTNFASLSGGAKPTYGSYVAQPRPAGLFAKSRVITPDSAGTGAFGVRMSPGMAQSLNTDPRYQSQRAGRLQAPAPAQSSGGGTTSPQVLAVRQALQRQAQASLTPQGGFQPTPHAGTATDVHGNDMAFQPRSSQTSTRARTGY